MQERQKEVRKRSRCIARVFPSSLWLSWSREREHNSHWEVRHTSHSANSEMNSSFQTQCMQDRRTAMACSSVFLFPFTPLLDRSALKPQHSTGLHVLVHQKCVCAPQATLPFIGAAGNRLESWSSYKNRQSFTTLLNLVTRRWPSWTTRIP